VGIDSFLAKNWVVQKMNVAFSEVNQKFIAYDVWEQSEKEGLELEAFRMRLEVVRQGFVDLVKR
jgi:hypothetical protein